MTHFTEFLSRIGRRRKIPEYTHSPSRSCQCPSRSCHTTHTLTSPQSTGPFELLGVLKVSSTTYGVDSDPFLTLSWAFSRHPRLRLSRRTLDVSTGFSYFVVHISTSVTYDSPPLPSCPSRNPRGGVKNTCPRVSRKTVNEYRQGTKITIVSSYYHCCYCCY